MKILKITILSFLTIVAFLVVFGYLYLYVLPKGPELTTPKPLEIGKGNFVMSSYKHTERKSIRVWTYKPDSWEPGNTVLFVMHGMARNAENYLDAWVDIAERKNILLIAPEFENEFYRVTTNDYQEGNLQTFFGVKNPESEWSYTVIENIFDYINENNDFSLDGYSMFGHSAGGQFVHRMVLLGPTNRIKKAIAANAGFYTFTDVSTDYPYGLQNINAPLEKSFSTDLTVLLGELDKSAELGKLRQTKNAMVQGGHRLERGTNFFNFAQEVSNRKKLEFNWRLQVVPNVGHNYKKMSEAASELL